jgi:hypothetical protein
MISTTWKCAPALALSLGLVACGGSSSSGPNPAGGSGGQSEPVPPAYIPLYEDSGLRPAQLPPNLHVDDEIRAAVTAGYIGFGALMATLDLRMDLQAYGWGIRGVIADWTPNDTDHEAYPGRGEVSCQIVRENGVVTGGGNLAVFQRDDPAGSTYRVGETIVFGFADCGFSGPTFTSDGVDVAEPRVQYYRATGSGEGRYEEFTLDGARHLKYYPAFDASGGPITIRQTPVAEGGRNLEWVVAVDEGAGLALGGDNGGPSLTISGQTVSYKQAGITDNELRFENTELAIEFVRGEEASDLDGTYLFSTEQLDVLYAEPRMTAGSFEVTTPDGTRYRFVLDGDPTSFTVTAYSSSEGEDTETSGLMSQAFVVERLNLAP